MKTKSPMKHIPS